MKNATISVPWGAFGSGGGLYEVLVNQMSAALTSLDPSVRREYDEAVQQAPHLVANETRFLDFLRTEDMDPHKAAQRLALYWKYRQEIFGNERWLLPMTQTGRGSLSSEDVRVLRTGYTVVLTRPTGGPVVLVDLSKLSYYPHEVNSRLVFYFVTVMTDASFQMEGVNIVHVITSAPRPASGTNPTGWKMFREGLQARVKQLIVVQAHEPWKEALLDSLSYQETLLAGFKTRTHANRITGHSIKAVLQQLQHRGLPSHYLPCSCGGTYSYSSFDDWMRARLTLEDAVSAASLRPMMFLEPHNKALSPTDKTTTTITTTINMKQSTLTPPPRRRRRRQDQHEKQLALAAAAAVAASHRRTTLMNHRYQTTAVVLTLPEQRHELFMNNAALRRENQRLEALLAQANAFVRGEESQYDVIQVPY